MLGGEHIFGVYVVTFDTWHLAILLDLVQGIMLLSQGKVLSPGNEGSMAVIVYISIFPSCWGRSQQPARQVLRHAVTGIQADYVARASISRRACERGRKTA